jgi:hypothetical protein
MKAIWAIQAIITLIIFILSLAARWNFAQAFVITIIVAPVIIIWFRLQFNGENK